jgi:uncharacterized protein YabN with tetrapyrrole methylase and pyrophosphatase domain
MAAGSLTVVGTGIRLSQLTAEARSHIESAEKLLFLVADPVSEAWLAQANPTAESLAGYYSPDKLRHDSYQQMVERVLACVREGGRVCLALYGHPGVFAFPAHEAVRRARASGYRATMLPAVSAEDCLFADLGIDPGAGGCQSFEATDFLISGRRFDPRVHLILWQIGVTGELGYKEQYDRAGLRVLVDVLTETYGPGYEVVVYEAARYLGCDPKIEIVALADVPGAGVSPISTLYVPPRGPTVPDPAMAARLGINWADLTPGATTPTTPP